MSDFTNYSTSSRRGPVGCSHRSGSKFHEKNTITSRSCLRNGISLSAMKRAFVLRLGPEARPASGKFEGRVEEVDSGRSLKFGSAEEFLQFLQRCLDEPASKD
jgi:hypothetical protein